MMPLYRSSLHSPLDANPTKYRGGGLSPLDANPTKYRSRENSPSVVWVPPNIGGLIGWYEFDEGTGLVVANSATDGSAGGGLLPNLTVFNSFQGLFWTYRTGFGSTPQLYFGSGDGADFAWSKPDRTIGGPNKATMGIFLRRKTSLGEPEGGKGGYGIAATGFQLFTCNTWASQGYSWTWGTSVSFPYNEALINVWLFHFLDDSGKYRIVKPDGTILTSVASVNLATVRLYTYAFAGVIGIDADPPTKGGYPGGSSYGDWIIYNGTTLSLAQWAQWYDELRSRYGMSARSGW